MKSEIITVYHGTNTNKLDSIVASGGILRPSLHKSERSWSKAGRRIAANDAIYISRTFLSAVIYGAYSKEHLPPETKTKGMEYVNFRPACSVVIFESQVPVELLKVEPSKIEVAGSSFNRLVGKNPLETMIDFEYTGDKLIPQKYVIVPSHSSLFRRPYFKNALTFFDRFPLLVEQNYNLSLDALLVEDSKAWNYFFETTGELFNSHNKRNDTHTDPDGSK